MGDASGTNACGTIQSCSTLNWQDLVCEEPGEYQLSLPGSDLSAAVAFLEELGGPTAGAGRAMHRVGVDAPRLRKTYKLEIEAMIGQIQRRLAALAEDHSTGYCFIVDHSRESIFLDYFMNLFSTANLYHDRRDRSVS